MSAGTDACAEIVARADPWRFRAVMAAPLAARPGLLALYAFNVEVSRAPWLTAEPMVAEMRLQFWRDAVEAIAAGDAPPGHEVARPLAEAMRRHGLPADELDALVTARRWDAWREPHADPAALEAYLDATSGGLMWLAARILGAGPEAEAPLRGAGLAAGAAAYLRAVPELAAGGRMPFPPGVDAAGLARMARGRLAAARRRRASVPPVALPALLPMAGAVTVLARAERRPEAVASGGVAISEARRRWAMAWMGLTGRW